MYKILKPLIDNYCVIIHNLIGSGGSSPIKKGLNFKNSIDYFIDTIEKWRKNMENYFFNP